MKTINNRPILMVLAVSLLIGLTGPITTLAATTPSLGSATSYGILGSTYTNTTAGTTVNGDIGFTTGPAVVPAGVHTNYGSGAPYPAAVTDQGTALSALAAQPCTFTFAPGAINLSTDATHGAAGIYTPGVYCSTGAMDVGGPLTLNGSGTYIFRPVGALTSDAGSVVTLTGASACDVFWTPSAATTLAANTTFAGTDIDDSGITVGANTTWTGRVLAGNGTVTTDTDTITVPSCSVPTATLHVIKVVVNTHGGIATPASFNLHVKLAGADVAGSPALGAAAPGTSYSLNAGTYAVSEDPNAAYVETFSGDCDAGGSITLASGDNKICTVTNSDIAPATATLHVIKQVVNTSGGVATPASFNLHVKLAGADVAGSPAAGAAAPGTSYSLNAGTYAVSEDPNAAYVETFSGDCDAGGNITLVSGDNKTCTVTNVSIAPIVPAPAPVSSGGGGGGSGPSTLFPPLIDLVKVPNPLALPGGSGSVKYTYTVTNPGTVPLTNVTLTDDSCSPITFVSGDTNSNSKLDANETWTYTCTTTLAATHTNSAIATGSANGMTATHIATATVIVGAPIVPPLIHVTKIPNPLVLPAGGGMVTYTEKITNPGTIPLSNVTLTDNKCSPMKFISGDTNNNSLLDPNETWTYTCSTNLSQTTTDTAVATGEANGITVRDIAIATVVVGTPVPTVTPTPPTPTLPNTGLPPLANNPAKDMAIPVVLALISISLAVVLRKRKV